MQILGTAKGTKTVPVYARLVICPKKPKPQPLVQDGLW